MLGDLFNRRQPGFWLSAGAHGALLLAAVLSFSSQKLPDSDEGIPVEVLTDNQFSEITKGELQASKPMPDPKPRVDRQDTTNVDRAPGEAKRDAPAPPKRPAEMKVADEEAEAASAPPPPLRLTDAKPEAVPPPAPPSRPDTAKDDAAKAEAAKAAETKAAEAKAADAKAEAAKAAVAKAEAAKVEAQKLAEQREAEALEQAKVEAARKAAALKAEADAKKAAEAKKAADAKKLAEAKVEAEAKMKALAEAAAKQEAAEQAKKLAEAQKLAEAKAEAAEKAKAEAAAKAKALAMAKAKAEAEAKARRQAELADKFSTGDIRQLLASKEPSQSTGATGREVNRTASLGTNTGTSQHLNPSQRDQIMGIIREQLIRCWQPPIALQNAVNPPVPRIRILLKEDGSLRADPSVENHSPDALFRTVADSAMRATRRCAPLRIPAQFAPYYQDWKDLVVGFFSDSMG